LLHPILLQLLMWYLLFTEMLPDASEAWQVGSVFLSKGGLNFPIPVWEQGHVWAAIACVAGLMLAWLRRRWARLQFEASGQPRSMFWVPLAIVLAMSVLGWLLGGAPLAALEAAGLTDRAQDVLLLPWKTAMRITGDAITVQHAGQRTEL
jgi:general L-amino acid transport system permease protein